MSGVAKAKRVSTLVNLYREKGMKINIAEIEQMGRDAIQKEIRKLKGNEKRRPVQAREQGYSPHDKAIETKKKRYNNGYFKSKDES